MSQLYELTAVEAASAIASGTLTSEALVRSCLDRIYTREETIGAWSYLDEEAALTQARECDHHPARGPLHGIPVGIKDIIDTHDMPTSYGSPIYRNHHPVGDAPAVALLRASGAVILGKTVTTEFAMFTPGKTANPNDPAHTPGGSSSGSAAAIADQMVPLALGTQTAGSIIRPASYCGVVGYKPTHGDFPIAGIKALAQSLDTLGGFARSLADLALLRSAMISTPLALPVVHDPPRIGVYRTPQWSEAEADTKAALDAAAQQCAAAGAEVCEVHLTADFAHLVKVQETIQGFEGVRCCAYELMHHREQLSPRLLEIMAEGLQISYHTYTEAVTTAKRCRRHLETVFANHDVLLVPSAPGEAPVGLASTGDPLFNRMWTILHVPAVNLPGHTGATGLPVGVQVVGRVGEDEHLLAIAAWVHNHLSDDLQ